MRKNKEVLQKAIRWHHFDKVDRQALRADKSMERQVLTHIYQRGRAVSQTELIAELNLERGARKELAIPWRILWNKNPESYQ